MVGSGARGEELAVLVDEDDRVIGEAPRSEVRRRNLLHRGTGVLCRNSAGEVYVHRRTDTKDVFPGMYDAFAGGMVASTELRGRLEVWKFVPDGLLALRLILDWMGTRQAGRLDPGLRGPAGGGTA